MVVRSNSIQHRQLSRIGRMSSNENIAMVVRTTIWVSERRDVGEELVIGTRMIVRILVWSGWVF